jgi:uncharacterized protein YndB with AHSA1/START domain
MAADTGSTLKVTTPSDREIAITRDFEAPRELMFEAMSRPEHVAQWWGRKGSTIEVSQYDFRPGGAWRFVEHGADGQQNGFRGEIREIVPPERIVQTFEWEGLPGHIAVDTLVLEAIDQGRKTKVTVTSRFSSVEDRDGMLQSGMEVGAAESYDRLAEYVRTLAA